MHIPSEISTDKTRFFQFIQTLTIGSACHMALGQIVGMAVEYVTATQYVIRVYVILLCALTILNELEWTRYATDSTLLRLWITRGLFYSFVGVLGLEENASSPKREGVSTILLVYLRVVAWSMVCCGVIYSVMGCACLQLVADQLKKDYHQRKERAKDVARAVELYVNDADELDFSAATV